MTTLAAVFSEVGKPLVLEPFELPERLEPGAMVCRVRMSTICGSDLHTIFGRRREPAPLILGHEILGEIVALGEQAPTADGQKPLSIGDRVTWAIMACCGSCYFCNRGLPQKCEHLRKYGHTCCHQPPHLTGGYAEHICLLPGTAVYRVPESLSDEIATPANCALSTVINAVETIGVARRETVLVQGAGMLGLNLIALCKEAGAAKVLVADVAEERLALAARFGADACIDTRGLSSAEFGAAVRGHVGPHGVDAAFEVCGHPAVVPLAVASLRIGGRYLIAGLVSAGSLFEIDGNQIARNCLTIKGIHNYRPEHLAQALTFLERHSAKYPYADLVGAVFPLREINEAVRAAASGKYVRVAVK